MDCQSLGSSRARGKRPFSERHAVTLPCTTSITGTTIKRDNPEQGSNCSQYIYIYIYVYVYIYRDEAIEKIEEEQFSCHIFSE